METATAKPEPGTAPTTTVDSLGDDGKGEIAVQVETVESDDKSKDPKEGSQMDDAEAKLIEDLKKIKEGVDKIFGLDEEKVTNFTWEHFFVAHCGILEVDALEYERNLISHRLSPEDTLIESLSLLVEFGRILLGDKLKIAKAIKRQEDTLRAAELQEAKKNTKILGLEKYTELEARQILALGGGTSEYHIEWGIEQFEEGKLELEKWMAEAMLTNPEAKEGFAAGSRMGKKDRDPAMIRLAWLQARL